MQGVDYNLNLDEETNKFTFTFNDPNNYVSGGCLKIEKISALGNNVANYTCISGSGGSIELTFSNLTGTSYKATGLISMSPYELVDTLYHTIDNLQTTGKLGLFLTAIFTIVFISTAYWNLPLSLIITPLPSIFFRAIQMIDVHWGLLIFMEAIMVLLAYSLSQK